MKKSLVKLFLAAAYACSMQTTINAAQPAHSITTKQQHDAMQAVSQLAQSNKAVNIDDIQRIFTLVEEKIKRVDGDEKSLIALISAVRTNKKIAICFTQIATATQAQADKKLSQGQIAGIKRRSQPCSAMINNFLKTHEFFNAPQHSQK